MSETQGTMRFNINFDIEVSAMRDWPPARIAQLFRGIATAIKAYEGVPEDDLSGSKYRRIPE